LNSIRTRIDELEAFNLEVENPTLVHSKLLENVQNSYDGVLMPLLLPLSHTAIQAADLARIEREALEHRDTIRAQLDQATTESKGILDEVKQALAAIKDTADEAGVASEGKPLWQREERVRGARFEMVLGNGLDGRGYLGK
jgi:phosphomevalonate kinase